MQEQIGRYEIRRELGRGGMATVFLAFDPRFRRQVAVKVLPRQFTHDPKYLERFESEAHTVATLEHPAIVPVYDFGDHEDAPYLVMRYMSGGTLEDRMTGEPLPLKLIVGIIERVAAALDKAHEMGIIHRDLKPANILFDDDGYPYLADFGIARLAEATQTMTVIGTPAYMSPEQVEGDLELDGRVDVYALGVMLYELFSGRQPYDAKTPTKLMMAHVLQPLPNVLEANPNLPPGAQAVIEKSMAKDRDQRYSTASEVVADLKELRDPDMLTDARAAATAAVIAPAIVHDTLADEGQERDDQPLEEAAPAAAAAAAAAAAQPVDPPANEPLPAAAASAAALSQQADAGSATVPPAGSGDKGGGLPRWLLVAGALGLLIVAALGIGLVIGGLGDDTASEPVAEAAADDAETSAEELPVEEAVIVTSTATMEPSTPTNEPEAVEEIVAPLVDPTTTATMEPSATPRATATEAATYPPPAAATETTAPPPTDEPTASAEPELQTPRFIVGYESVNVREGPGNVFDIAAIRYLGDALDVIGRNSNNTWYVVSLPDNKSGWIASVVGALEDGNEQLVIPLAATIPPWPTSTPTPIPTATPTRLITGTITPTVGTPTAAPTFETPTAAPLE